MDGNRRRDTYHTKDVCGVEEGFQGVGGWPSFAEDVTKITEGEEDAKKQLDNTMMVGRILDIEHY